MPIDRTLVTGDAVLVGDVGIAEVGWGFAQADDEARVGLKLLPHATRCRLVAHPALQLLMPYIHRTRCAEVLLTGCE
jgi:hypothetical protein